MVTQYISKAKFDEKEFLWKELETLSHTFKKNLRRVFVNLDFGSTSKKDSLMEAVDFLKENITKKRSLSGIKAYNFPQTFITRKSRRYIIEKKKVKVKGSPRKVMEIKPDRYEFLIYSQLRECLESGDIYVQDSTQFQSFESDLVDDERWINKEQLIQDLNLPFLSRPIEETLMELEDEFETLLVEVNQRIKDGTNKGIKITATKENIKWSFPYKKTEDKTNHPLFGRLPQIEIRELLDFVDSQCGFMNAFTHILGRYIKNESEDNAIVGSVIALATNKGILKMSESSDLTYQVLFSAMKNYLRLETLREANDRISNSLFQLPVFKSFNIKEDTIHSSSDGQKFETQINTINARYSPKYFGLKKGVTSYTMVANNVPVNAKIIGTNEHESHFVFDIVYNNTSDIRSDRHAVDTHGTNNVNFLVLHAFGYEFTPRYRDLNSKTKTIYGFKGIKEYEELLLKPTRKVNEKLIKKEWPNIQRILVSLGLKSTTQSVIIGKLSSYARKNRTKRAMWELDNIFRSIYLLKYIDDMLLRQNVQRALNRSESYHQLRRAIPHEHSGKFRLYTEEEQQVFSECSRLTANAIIFYNSYLLNKLISHMEEKKRFDIVKRIKKVSPIAWQHINLHGRYEFTIQINPPNIDSMIGTLEEFLTD